MKNHNQRICTNLPPLNTRKCSIMSLERVQDAHFIMVLSEVVGSPSRCNKMNIWDLQKVSVYTQGISQLEK